jgi:hypothetical protein
VYEPKYELNKKDSARWHSLLIRHCLEAPRTPGGKVKIDPRHPPLTPEENVEFERLTKKRSRKIASHPKAAEQIHQSKLMLRRADYRLKKLLELVKRLKTGKSC